MAQYPIELILTRQLASQLATPVFIVDANGTLVFYNEAAEGILGLRFDETGAMPASEWAKTFTPRDAAGRPLAPESLPLIIALRDQRPAHADSAGRGPVEDPERTTSERRHRGIDRGRAYRRREGGVSDGSSTRAPHLDRARAPNGPGTQQGTALYPVRSPR